MGTRKLYKRRLSNDEGNQDLLFYSSSKTKFKNPLKYRGYELRQWQVDDYAAIDMQDKDGISTNVWLSFKEFPVEDFEIATNIEVPEGIYVHFYYDSETRTGEAEYSNSIYPLNTDSWEEVETLTLKECRNKYPIAAGLHEVVTQHCSAILQGEVFIY